MTRSMFISCAMPLLLAMLLTLSGCSFVFVKKPPMPPPAKQWVACTENVLWPVVDAAAAVLMVSPMVYLAASYDEEDLRTLGLVLGAPLFLGSAAALGYSSFRGFSTTARCREIHREYEREVAEEFGALPRD